MKIKQIALVGILAMGCVAGWWRVMNHRISVEKIYRQQIAQADEWKNEGLYQKAIASYQQALNYKSTDEIWQKVVETGEKYLLEEEDYQEEYQNLLETAVTACPDNLTLYKKLIGSYMDKENQQAAYQVCEQAVRFGVADEEIKRRVLELEYQYTVSEDGWIMVERISEDTYKVCDKENIWRYIDASGEAYDIVQENISRTGENGIHMVLSEQESRIIDGNDVVLGIIPFKADDVGVCAENKIVVENNGIYSYYDTSAQLLFGGYETAGTFFDGTAAVKKGGTWCVINEHGEVVGENYADIILDEDGYYNRQKAILAAKEAGKYHIYNKKWKEVENFISDEVDVLTEDNLFAFRQGQKWGFATTEGEIVIEPQYESAKSFSNGLAAVCKDGKWGFINTENELVIEYQYMDADYFNQEGSCMVAAREEEEQVWKLLVLDLGILR